MTRIEVLKQLRRLIQRIRCVLFFQVSCDFLMMYGFIKIILSQEKVSLLGRFFPSERAMVIVFLVAIVDLMLVKRRKDLVRFGVKQAEQLMPPITMEEALVLRKFIR